MVGPVVARQIFPGSTPAIVTASAEGVPETADTRALEKVEESGSMGVPHDGHVRLEHGTPRMWGTVFPQRGQMQTPSTVPCNAPGRELTLPAVGCARAGMVPE
jgi:hypothetical protein